MRRGEGEVMVGLLDACIMHCVVFAFGSVHR